MQPGSVGGRSAEHSIGRPPLFPRVL